MTGIGRPRYSNGVASHTHCSAGAEHHIISLEWSTRPDPGKIQLAARVKRYEALFKFCREKGIRYLMTAHHKDDQLGKVM